jgi:[protein-PII] uridylyltransferase
VAQSEFRAAFTEWPEQELNAYMGRHYPAYWLKVELPRKIRHARFVRSSEQAGHKLAINVGFDEARGVTELTILAVDHPWLLSIIAGACASAGANIVDAQIYTTTDGRALDTIAITREYDRDEDEGRRATRIGDMIEDVLEGKLRLPEAVARRAAGRGRARPFVVESEVIINNQWSDRYTVIEVSGLDRPGLLYELTTAISKLNLNIASAHVATFGERARDVFYVTDLLGAQVTAPTRQAAIKSALLHLLATDETAAQPAA